MGVYLYCIGHASQITADRVKSLASTAADGSASRFRVVEYENLAALVSDTEVRQFELQRESLMAHHHVLEEATQLGDILPISYGTVAERDQDVVDELLAGAADQLAANLAHIEGRVELSLRAMWREGQLFQEIVEEVPEIRELRDVIAGVPEDASYYERIRLGELTSQAIMYKNEAEREQMLESLVPLSADIDVTPSNSDTLILNGAFLVEREREPEFDEAVQEVARVREERMAFRYIGPLPPASFVSISVNAEH